MLPILLCAQAAHAQAGWDIVAFPSANDDSFEVYSQVNSETTTTVGFHSGQMIFVPHAAMGLTPGVYDEVCVNLNTAGPVGSTLDLMLYSSNINQQPSTLLWTGVVPNDVVGLACEAFQGGTWESGALGYRFVDDDFIAYTFELFWVGIKKSAGTNRIVALNQRGTRSLGSSADLVGVPLHGFTVAPSTLTNPIDPATLGRWDPVLPVVGFHPNRLYYPNQQ